MTNLTYNRTIPNLQIGQVDVVRSGLHGAFDGGGNVTADLPHEAEIAMVKDVFVLDELGVVFGDPIAEFFVENAQFHLFARRIQ